MTRTFALMLPLIVLLAGCRGGGSLNVTSLKDPYFPERYTVGFDECAVHVAPGGDLHFLARTTQQPRNALVGPITQYLHVHMFWRPRPGRTFDNPTAQDSTVQFLITTPSGCALYEGTGFVYADPKKGRGDLRATLEQAGLRPAGATDSTVELLGETRMTATLRAARNSGQAVDMLRKFEQLAEMAGRGGVASAWPR